MKQIGFVLVLMIYLSLPELHQNPLVQRVIEIFDQDGNGEVDFKEFIEGVSQFSVKGDKDSKLKCKIIPKNQFLVYTINYVMWYKRVVNNVLVAFKIYDMDKDGFISNGELFQVLKMMVGNNLKGMELIILTISYKQRIYLSFSYEHEDDFLINSL